MSKNKTQVSTFETGQWSNFSRNNGLALVDIVIFDIFIEKF